MFQDHDTKLRLHHQRVRQLRESARADRRTPRPESKRPRRTIRRFIGDGMVSVGTRLAADASHEPARSR